MVEGLILGPILKIVQDSYGQPANIRQQLFTTQLFHRIIIAILVSPFLLAVFIGDPSRSLTEIQETVKISRRFVVAR